MKSAYTEWLKQAEYDMDTAVFMFGGKRYFYAVFMCHLAIEKALKGLYQKTLQTLPPKTHNLLYLLDEIGVKPSDVIGQFIVRLNQANIATRYPETIEMVQSIYTREVSEQILAQSKGVLEWIKQQY